MKSVGIICCLLIAIFALAVAHPLPANVLEQVEAKPDPTAPALLLKDPTAPALLLKDPTAPALLLKDPTAPALLLKDPTAPAYLQKPLADDNAATSDVSQDDPPEQQDPEAITYSEETLEDIFYDVPLERELQNEE